MTQQTVTPQVLPWDLYDHAIKWFAVVIASAKRRIELAPHLEKSQRLLETLPLTTEEYSLAVGRLRNSERYLEHRETGSACHELIALMRILVKKRNAERDVLVTFE